MDIVLTGTGSPLPDANRAGPSTLVKAGDTHILIDAGRGVVMRMAGAGTLPVFLRTCADWGTLSSRRHYFPLLFASLTGRSGHGFAIPLSL